MNIFVNAGICLFLLFLPFISDNLILRIIENIIHKINSKNNNKKITNKIKINRNIRMLNKKYPKNDIKQLDNIKKMNAGQFRQLSEYWQQLFMDYLSCYDKNSINFNSDLFSKIINIISYVAIAIYPIIIILLTRCNIFNLYIIPGAILGIIIFFNYTAGRWQHQTKSGKADMRYSRENNKYISAKISDIGIKAIISLILLVISYIISNAFL